MRSGARVYHEAIPVPNQNDIQRRLSELGWTALQVKGSALDILGASKALDDGEQIEQVISCRLGKLKGLLFATDRRLVFVNQGLIKSQSESFRYDKISSVQYETGLLSATLAMIVDGRTLRAENVAKDQGPTFADHVRRRAGSS